MNHRCAHRIIRLVNRIRADVDQWEQVGRSDRPEGVVHLFVLPSTIKDKPEAERRIAQRMAHLTGDSAWGATEQAHKTLILEHHMAARRLGFADLFDAVYAVDGLRTGLLDGDLPELRVFSKQVLPLVTAHRNGERFRAAAVVRQHSPLLRPDELQAIEGPQMRGFQQAKAAADALLALWSGRSEPTFAEVLHTVADTRLFEIPDSLAAILQSPAADDADSDDARGESDRADERLTAWNAVLRLPFAQIEPYEMYATGESPFGTHQGVKGLEFPRVMVIADDSEARGFLFSYEKLLGAQARTSSDRKNEQAGKETTYDRTRRLFYVTCSRAIDSLAIVAYSSAPEQVRTFAIDRQWFDESEVEIWDSVGPTLTKPQDGS
jgi:DNA helicase-2/ATP-dependent DNA helicase PcrA